MEKIKAFWSKYDYAFIFFLMPISVLILLFGFMIHNENKFVAKFKDGPVKIGVTALGCDKYQYFNEIYYECPADLKVKFPDGPVVNTEK